jgi:hypothetical protein
MACENLAPVHAHPMPETEMKVVRSGGMLHLLIQVPLPDLMLALPTNMGRARTMLEPQPWRLKPYLTAHTHVVLPSGSTQHVSIESARIRRTRAADVRSFAEVEVTASVRLDQRTAVVLRYDGVLHRVANHRVRVQTNAGLPIGVIEYRLATKQGTSLLLPGALSAKEGGGRTSLWAGVPVAYPPGRSGSIVGTTILIGTGR